jgi:protein phosphatase
MASVGASLFSTRPQLSWDFAALTDVGRARAHNEDDLHVDPALGLAVLADGMGGYKGGEKEKRVNKIKTKERELIKR